MRSASAAAEVTVLSCMTQSNITGLNGARGGNSVCGGNPPSPPIVQFYARILLPPGSGPIVRSRTPLKPPGNRIPECLSAERVKPVHTHSEFSDEDGV